MNFLFVDRILAMDPGKHAVALKHVTASDAYLFKNHDHAIALHSCIVGEAIGQLCSWNVIQATGTNFRLIGGVVGEVILHRDPLLGETVILENTIDRLDLENKVCHFRGSARIGEECILELNDGLGPIMPVADFGCVDQVKREYRYLYRPGEIPQPISSYSTILTSHLNSTDLHYDRILEWKKGEYMVAQKNISMTAPYFHDHFPHRPVLPVTLMVQSNLLLAHDFLNDLISKNERLQAKVVKRIKMNDFVEPGDMIITTVQLKKQDKHSFIVTFRSESGGRRIFISEAEFEVKPV